MRFEVTRTETPFATSRLRFGWYRALRSQTPTFSNRSGKKSSETPTTSLQNEEAFLHYVRATTQTRQVSPHGCVVSSPGDVQRGTANAIAAPGPRTNKHSTVNRLQFQRTAHIRERLAERHFFFNQLLAVLDETLSALNLAERSGAIAETISGYSALGLGLGMSGLRRMGRYDCARALNVAEEGGNLPIKARAHLLAAVFGYGWANGIHRALRQSSAWAVSPAWRSLALACTANDLALSSTYVAI